MKEDHKLFCRWKQMRPIKRDKIILRLIKGGDYQWDIVLAWCHRSIIVSFQRNPSSVLRHHTECHKNKRRNIKMKNEKYQNEQVNKWTWKSSRCHCDEINHMRYGMVWFFTPIFCVWVKNILNKMGEVQTAICLMGGNFGHNQMSFCHLSPNSLSTVALQISSTNCKIFLSKCINVFCQND